jgi:ADP-ribosylglycohydrolase
MEPIDRARLALDGLSVGDAFGQRFFVSPSMVEGLIAERALPAAPWSWTDDTAMALSVYDVLVEREAVDRDRLAALFAQRYTRDPLRGYGGTAHGILQRIAEGVHWSAASGVVFDGQGSMGNGGAMRVAPVGGWFAEDLDRVVENARASAEPTHAHPEGQAGAVAVALAAALASRARAEAITPEELLRHVVERTPAGPTREGLERAAAMPLSYDPRTAAEALGSGALVISSDTVPFSIWCAARHLFDFEEAMWTTVSGLGDRDTTCAIVGGIVALAVGHEGIPAAFLAAREPLDSTLTGDARHEVR